MLKKKVCLLGVYGVGKTSLVRSFVYSLFEDKYLSTVGVKIDKKPVTIGAEEVELVLWDIAGEDDHFSVPPSYLRGSSGHLLVIDGTRRETFERALDLQKRTEDVVGRLPFIAVLNKADLADEWQIGAEEQAALAERNWPSVRTSAKTGAGVEEAFLALGREILRGPQRP